MRSPWPSSRRKPSPSATARCSTPSARTVAIRIRPTYSRVVAPEQEALRRRARAGLAACGRARACTSAFPRDGDRPVAPRRADHRRRLDLDGDDAVQPQPARARRPRRRRRDCRGRRPAGLQHDRRLRQPVAGNAGDALLADLARGDRRLDRADGARARLRRPRLPGRLRQDGAGRPDGARPRRQAGRRPLRRPDARRPLARPRRDDSGRLGGGRRGGERADAARRPRRARAACVSRAGHVRRPLHRQHDGRRARLPRDRPDRRRADPGRRARGEGRGGRRRPAPWRCSSPSRRSRRGASSTGARS